MHTENPFNLKFNEALALAIEAHRTQVRKCTENAHGIAVPYITHPVAVAALVIQFGGSEDQVLAALLHDVLEDGAVGIDWHARILVFGEPVLNIVLGCSDGSTDPDTGHKAPWLDRKLNYLTHLGDSSADILLVSACDKLHNLQSIRMDLEKTGLSVFDRFNVSNRELVLWYYSELCNIFKNSEVPVANNLIDEFSLIQKWLVAHLSTDVHKE